MDNVLTPPPSPQQEALKRELQRRSLDTIRVYNLLDEDYILDWDGFKHKIPAKTQKSLPRYLAEKFTREVKDKFINDLQDAEVDKAKKKFQKQGTSPSDITYLANDSVQSKYKTNDPKLVEYFYKQIWLGVEEKYGLDAIPEKTPERGETKPVEEQVLADLDKPFIEGTGETSTPSQIPPVKDDIVSEVSA